MARQDGSIERRRAELRHDSASRRDVSLRRRGGACHVDQRSLSWGSDVDVADLTARRNALDTGGIYRGPCGLVSGGPVPVDCSDTARLQEDA